jgi:hypothetical protein
MTALPFRIESAAETPAAPVFMARTEAGAPAFSLQ